MDCLQCKVSVMSSDVFGVSTTNSNSCFSYLMVGKLARKLMFVNKTLTRKYYLYPKEFKCQYNSG